MTKDSKYIEFIHKKLVGSISSEEQVLLEDWISSSSENETTAAEITEAWDHSQHYLSDYQPKVEEGLTKLKNRIAEDQQAAPVRSLPRRRWILQLAAAIALLIGVGISINYFAGQGTIENWLALDTTAGSVQKHVLSDGSIVWLNENSRLDYPETFNTQQRLVKLQGEAFFDIARDEEKPFLIQTEEATVKVLGTSFNVRSYETEEEVEVMVKSGKVQFEVKEIAEEMILQPTDCYRYNKSVKTIEKVRDETFNALSWQTKKLAFVKTPLAEVLTKIEKYYKVKISIQDSSLKNCKFTAKFNDTPLNDVLEILKASFSLQVNSPKEDEYILIGGQCS